MAAQFRPAPEVERIARDLIATVGEHEHLASAHVVYLWRTGSSWTSRGREMLGQARLLGALDRHLLTHAEQAKLGAVRFADTGESADTEADEQILTVIINGDAWPRLTPAQHRALVDHELCHFVLGDTERWEIAGHDVEEFSAVIRRHGLWLDDVRRFAREMVQLRLFEPSRPEPETETAEESLPA